MARGQNRFSNAKPINNSEPSEKSSEASGDLEPTPLEAAVELAKSSKKDESKVENEISEHPKFSKFKQGVK